jgi:RNA recognition motif-containing protein
MDVFDMFSTYGPVERVIIHCNYKSHKIGTAEVCMSSRTDAATAKRKLNTTDVFNGGIY